MNCYIPFFSQNNELTCQKGGCKLNPEELTTNLVTKRRTLFKKLQDLLSNNATNFDQLYNEAVDLHKYVETFLH